MTRCVIEDVPDERSGQWYGGPGSGGRQEDSRSIAVRPATTALAVRCGPDWRLARPPRIDDPDRSLAAPPSGPHDTDVQPSSPTRSATRPGSVLVGGRARRRARGGGAGAGVPDRRDATRVAPRDRRLGRFRSAALRPDHLDPRARRGGGPPDRRDRADGPPRRDGPCGTDDRIPAGSGPRGAARRRGGRPGRRPP